MHTCIQNQKKKSSLYSKRRVTQQYKLKIKKSWDGYRLVNNSIAVVLQPNADTANECTSEFGKDICHTTSDHP